MSDIPKFSTRLWSEEVGMADAFDPLPMHDPGYEWSNGRKFRDGKGAYGHGNGHGNGNGNGHHVDAYFDIATAQAQRAIGVAAVATVLIDSHAATAQGQRSTGAGEVLLAQGDAVVRTASVSGTAAGVGKTSSIAVGSTAQAQRAALLSNAIVAVVNTASVGGTASGVGAAIGSGVQSGTPIAVGKEIAPLSVENTSSSAATNQPFTIGHAFAIGHLPATGAAISLTLSNGTTIQSQLNVKALHADGSVRHAIVSGVIPSIAGGATVALSMKRAAAPASGSSVGVPASLPKATAKIGGVLYTADAASVSPVTWFSGPVASDFVFMAPFRDPSGGAHQTLMGQFSVRAFASGQVRVDFDIEHCQAYASTTDITYDATLYLAGQAVYTKAGLVHTPTGRWKRTFWQNSASTLHVKHDIPYLLDSKLIPNYDRSIKIAEPYLSGLAADLASTNFDPMQFGRFVAYMPTTGGRNDIGLLPDSHVAWVLSMDKRAKAVALASGDIGGSWPVCRRDDTSGPGRGYPLSIVNLPYASTVGTVGDNSDPATGKPYKLPSLTTATLGVPDVSHHPSIYYLPYLLTGDYFYLEGLQFFATYNAYSQLPGYRDFDKGLVNTDQVRGQAWSMRTMVQAAAITPDDHPLKAHFSHWYDANTKWFLDAYLDAPNPAYANQIGFLANGYAFSYSMNGGSNNGIAPWQDDFFTQALGHGYELLGLATTKRLLTWKSRFQLNRMNDPAVCVMNSCTYSLGVRSDGNTAMFPSLGECFGFTISDAEEQYPCGSPQRLAYAGSKCLPGDIDGYPDSNVGFASDYQPALAMCCDLGLNGVQAWTKFMARPTKPDYGLYGAQFAVVARTITAPGTVTSTGSVTASQAQGAAAVARTTSIGNAATKQGQTSRAAGSGAASIQITTRQGQSSSGAAAGGARFFTVATKQGQGAAGAIAAASQTGPVANLTYTSSDVQFSNPERGFYVHLLHGGAFTANNLNQYKAQQMSIVLYQPYLTAYKTSPIDAAFLNAFQANLNSIRSLGMKTVLRFAYDANNIVDASLAQVQAHMDQLAPYLSANADIIMGMQCGWVGQWGESQASSNFGTDSWPPSLSAANKAARKAVMDKAMAVMPANRWVQTRQPWMKMQFYGTTPATAADRNAANQIGRLGHFDDCFLSGSTDAGTFTTDPVGEMNFLAADTKYLPMGGETCTFNEPRSSGATALTEMTRFHWTFCNSGYQDQVITSWKNSGHYATFNKRLGYRLRLASATFPTSATRGSAMAIKLDIVNDGFAAPVSQRTAKLVLRNKSTGAVTALSLAAEVRDWFPGSTIAVSESLTVPAGLAAGSYDLLLWLPDPASNLASNPAYAIQLANVGVWEASTGYNLLGHTVVIS